MPDNPLSLDGRRALITGATGGIGTAIAHAMHSMGASVVISGTRQERLAELRDELGERVHAVPCNLHQRENVRTLIPRAVKALGSVDILVNNAGITRDGLLMRMPDTSWDDVLAINLTAAMILCRAALRPMMRSRWGRIVNVTSVVGLTGNPGQTNYCASKAGLIGFSKSLAQEVASRGITVNCIAPGFIETEMTGKLTETQRGRILGSIPLSRMGSPGDIAQAALYLASDGGEYLTGQTIHVNGGMAMP